MDAKVMDKLTDIAKALEAGYALGPVGGRVQGAALQIQDMSPVMNNLTFGDDHIKLQKWLPTVKAKAMVYEYQRQLSYGQLDGMATLEISAGQQDQGQYVKAFAAMAFYHTQAVVSVAATMVKTFDGVNNEEREAKNAAMRISGFLERDLFSGKADFSNAGVFDGNPAVMPQIMGNLVGLDPQIRQADSALSATALDFIEYGAGDSVIINVGGSLSQESIEDGRVRSIMNFGYADELYVDPQVHAEYNKIVFGKERIVLAGSPQKNTGGELGGQWTVSGPVKIVDSRFISGKTRPPAQYANGAPAAPSISAATFSSSTSFTVGDVLSYYVTGSNEIGEGAPTAISSMTVGVAGQGVRLTITPSGSGNAARWFNVYRSAPGAAATSNTKLMAFVGRVAAAVSGTTTFDDLNNRLPGSVTGFLLDKRGHEVAELAPFSKRELARVDSAERSLWLKYCCLAVTVPRFNVLLSSLTGTVR